MLTLRCHLKSSSFKRLNETGTTVIMVTHAHELVKKFDNRVIVLEGGTIVSDGAVSNGEIPIHSSSHLNIEVKEAAENKITQKFVSVKEEAPVEEPKNENPDENFLNALVSDTDAYRVYLEEDDFSAKTAVAEKTEGGDAE